MSEAMVMRSVAATDNWIVAGAHWSWGMGYATYEAALSSLHSARVGFGYTRCSVHGGFVAGVHEHPHTCTGCTKRAARALADTTTGV